jgi:predicted DCC family thiol-disulfide oxidoreductase YuxK
VGEAAVTRSRAGGSPPAIGPAVLVYDGECALCRASAFWLLRRAMAGGARELELLPCSSPVRRARYPQISDEACLTAMQLVLPDGRVLAGADAVPEILRRIPRWRWLAGLFDLPGIRPVARRVYAWIARHRMRLSCGVGGRR